MADQTIHVELNTAWGQIFNGIACSVELHTGEGLIAITGTEKNYLSLMQTTEITLHVGTEFRVFILENASASLSQGNLTILAERITLTRVVAEEEDDPDS
jgi:F0F1-type ATP synthase epsilon subunit